MKRVLYVVHHSIFGGPHNHALRLYRPLARRGWELIILLPDEPGNAAARLRAGGVALVQLPLHRLRASLDPRLALSSLLSVPGEVAAIRRIIREQHIDLVALAGLVNPHAALAARLEDTAVLWKIIDTRTPPVLRWIMMRAVWALADAVMFTGDGLVATHAKPGSIRLPCFTFYPPVDTRRFAPSPKDRREIRGQLAIPPEALVVGTVANLNPQKGLEHFIRAAAIIRRDLPQTWFIVVGGRHPSHSAYADRLLEAVKNAGLEDRFRWLGAQADIERFYPAMDVKVISSVSRSEGVPTTAIEAISCGVPVVTADVGAVSEVVVTGVTGYVVQAGDAPALAHATLTLLRDPRLREEIGRQGRQRALERYDVEVCAASQAKAFEEILESRGDVAQASQTIAASRPADGGNGWLS